MELRSLYQEPARREQISFGALELHDVFKIYRSGPAETVALRGLDLRVERNEALVLEALELLRRDFGSTVVVVTHSPRVADAADRLLELRDGRLV